MDFKNLHIKGLEDKHKISLLLFLLENGPTMKSVIYENISTNPRMADKIDELAKMGLVTIDWRKFQNNAMIICLTPVGTMIAEKLRDIELLMSKK